MTKIVFIEFESGYERLHDAEEEVTSIMEKHGFKDETDYELVIAMGGDFAHGVRIFNKEILKNSDIMHYLNLIEGNSVYHG